MKEKILVFIKNEFGEYLLLRNNPTDPAHGGDFWYTVTGGFDPGETDGHKVAVREIKEETNLDVIAIENLNWSFIYDQNHQTYIEYTYLATTRTDDIILNEENIDYKWLPLEQLIQEIKWYGNKIDIENIIVKRQQNIQLIYGPFLINFKEEDLELIKDLKTTLSDYQRVLDYLNYQVKKPITINIYDTKLAFDQTLKQIHPTWFSEDIPTWVNGFVGEPGDNDIHMLNPNNNETEHDYESNLGVPFHEFIHIIANHIKVKEGQIRPHILEEGITTFLNNQAEEWVKDTIIEDIKQNNLPTSELLTTTDTNTFHKQNGYEYAYFFMAYLDEMYGSKKIVQYLQEPDLLVKEINWADFIIYLKQKLYNKDKR